MWYVYPTFCREEANQRKVWFECIRYSRITQPINCCGKNNFESHMNAEENSYGLVEGLF